MEPATDRIVCQNALKAKRRTTKTAYIVEAGRSRRVLCRTRNNRAPFWVVARDSYGHEEVVYRCISEDCARVFHQRRVEAGRDYTVTIVDNITRFIHIGG